VKSIIFKDVHKNFGKVAAINGLNLNISEGEVYAFLGHNGAGKTTTLRLMLGLLEPSGGIISVFGNNPIKDGNAVRRNCPDFCAGSGNVLNGSGVSCGGVLETDAV